MATKLITAMLIVAAAVCCSGARERFGKLTRQARQVVPVAPAIDQAVVTNSIASQAPQAQEAFEPAAAPQARQVYQQQTFPQPQAPYQAVPQQLQQYQTLQPQPQQQIPPQQYVPAAPQPIQPQQYRPVVPQPQTSYPQTSPFDSSALINQVSQTAPAYSQYVSVTTTRTLVDKLPSNSTRIRPNLVEGFSCQGKRYGYYADVLNDCQVFHVCYPLKDVFKNHPEVPDITYDFSFICNDFLAFDQSSLTCGWATEVVPCENAEELYDVVNSRFFEVPRETAPQGATGIAGSGSGGYQVPAPVSVTAPQIYPVPGQSVPAPGGVPQVYPVPGQSVPAPGGVPQVYPGQGQSVPAPVGVPPFYPAPGQSVPSSVSGPIPGSVLVQPSQAPVQP